MTATPHPNASASTRRAASLRAPNIADRIPALDWLRVAAFALLIFFHTAVLFLPDGIPNLLNAEPSPTLTVFVAFFHEFRLDLLFLVSGLGAAFTLRRRSPSAFLSERARRLLIPLAFGIAAVVPPMVYLEKIYNAEFQGGFGAFYLTLLDGRTYPEGALSWHHYWFIAYLFLFCLIALPIFRHWKTEAGAANLAAWADWAAQGPRLFAICLPFIAIELALRPVFPGFRNLLGDWASFSHWFIVFLAGFAFGQRRELLETAKTLLPAALFTGVCGSAILFALYFDAAEGGLDHPREVTWFNAASFFLFSTLRVVSAWAWLLVCVGAAMRWMNSDSRLLRALNQAVYPLFCLHLTLIVALGFWILPLEISTALKFLTISFGTIAIALALYRVAIRRSALLSALLGARTPNASAQGAR